MVKRRGKSRVPFATTWERMEDVTRSQVSQKVKDKMISLRCRIERNRQFPVEKDSEMPLLELRTKGETETLSVVKGS